METLEIKPIEVTDKDDIFNTPISKIKESYRTLKMGIYNMNSTVNILAPKHWFIDEDDCLDYVAKSEQMLDAIKIFKADAVFEAKYFMKLAKSVGGIDVLYNDFLLEYIAKLHDNKPHDYTMIEKSIGVTFFQVYLYQQVVKKLEDIVSGKIKPEDLSGKYVSMNVYEEFLLIRLTDDMAENMRFSMKSEEDPDFFDNDEDDIPLDEDTEFIQKARVDYLGFGSNGIVDRYKFAHLPEEVLGHIFQEWMEIYNVCFDMTNAGLAQDFIDWPNNTTLDTIKSTMNEVLTWES